MELFLRENNLKSKNKIRERSWSAVDLDECSSIMQQFGLIIDTCLDSTLPENFLSCTQRFRKGENPYNWVTISIWIHETLAGINIGLNK